MSQAIEAVRPIAELLYFLSGIALTFGLWITYGQLKALRKDSTERAERAAKEKAIEAANAYVSLVIPKINEAYRSRKKAGIDDRMANSGVDFKFNVMEDRWIIDEEHKRAIDKTGAAINRLEAVAAYFVTGVADELTGFNIFGRSFCRSVEHNYKLIAFTRMKQVHPSFQSIVKLYGMWKPRISTGEVEQRVAQMRARIVELENGAGARTVGGS